jgi:putative transposase
MDHTYTQVLVHAIFSTKQREPYLSDEIKAELFPYLAGSLRRMKARAVIVNGPRDHVHLLLLLPAVLSLADAMEKVKANSSKWLHQRWPRQRAFAWQTGYAAFSVSQSNLALVRDYIARQEERHRKMTYQEEVLALLGKHGIEYDPRFVFDCGVVLMSPLPGLGSSAPSVSPRLSPWASLRRPCRALRVAANDSKQTSLVPFPT